jgi:hypothetical protein
MKHVKYREGELLSESTIFVYTVEECDKTGCKTGSWRVIYVLRFSKNSAEAEEAGRIGCCQRL